MLSRRSARAGRSSSRWNRSRLPDAFDQIEHVGAFLIAHGIAKDAPEQPDVFTQPRIRLEWRYHRRGWDAAQVGRHDWVDMVAAPEIARSSLSRTFFAAAQDKDRSDASRNCRPHLEEPPSGRLEGWATRAFLFETRRRSLTMRNCQFSAGHIKSSAPPFPIQGSRRLKILPESHAAVARFRCVSAPCSRRAILSWARIPAIQRHPRCGSTTAISARRISRRGCRTAQSCTPRTACSAPRFRRDRWLTPPDITMSRLWSQMKTAVLVDIADVA